MQCVCFHFQGRIQAIVKIHLWFWEIYVMLLITGLSKVLLGAAAEQHFATTSSNFTMAGAYFATTLKLQVHNAITFQIHFGLPLL